MRVLSIFISAVLGWVLFAPPASASQVEAFQPRIINGDSVVEDEAYPWMVALLRSNVENNFQAQFCGGSLIAPNVVITAAHCTEDFSPSGIDVLVGATDLMMASSEDRIQVDQIINHQSYNPISLRNDIALLILDTEVSAVPSSLYTEVASALEVTAIGWGATEPDGSAYPTILQKGQLATLGDCSEWGSSYHSQSMICAEGELVGGSSVDTCFGDSGGPLFLGDGTEEIMLVGLTSWGSDPCAANGLPGVYTRVSSYLEWVSIALTPVVSSFSPSSAAPGTTLRLTGRNLASVTQVRFGSVVANVLNSNSTSATVLVPPGATSGRLGAISSYPEAEVGNSRSSFTVRYPSPKVSRVSPTQASVGEAVLISGSGFFGATSVSFSRTDAPEFEVLSDRQIEVVVPEGATNGRVTVRNPSKSASGGSFSLAPTPGAPTLTRLSSTSGAPGQVITISGTNLDTTLSVTFDGRDAEFEAESSTRLLATVPTGASSGPIEVENLVGSASWTRSFTVRYPSPKVSRVSPTQASVGEAVLISGSGFFGATSVSFSRTDAPEFEVLSDRQIEVVVPEGATNGRVTVRNPSKSASGGSFRLAAG